MQAAQHPLQRRDASRTSLLRGAGMALLVACAGMAHAQAPAPLAASVNTFIGTKDDGNTFPGASAPFGLIQVSPIGTHYSGWRYDDEKIYGFGHSFLSGAGCPTRIAEASVDGVASTGRTTTMGSAPRTAAFPARPRNRRRDEGGGCCIVPSYSRKPERYVTTSSICSADRIGLPRHGVPTRSRPSAICRWTSPRAASRRSA